MSQRSFVDTNILVYAHDRSAGEKHQMARHLVERLWEERSAAISTQVLQELYVNLRRQASRPLSRSRAAAISSRAEVLYSEALNAGQRFGGTVVRNPLRA